MNKSNRDLLVLFNQELMTPQSIEQEVELLHQLLYGIERIENLIIAHEAINLNKYKISNKPLLLQKLFRQRELKPFVFLNCKN
ncbi:MAG: hypothetical protein IPO01_17050 [Chitinophagaceae bacterium]|nr:hypothetical protein [Chitinophagaceae bacterium]MBK7308564.1 hypothetical protein [Chitinophagaceae bacterium]MBK8785509.1 hypothetical protein [Chitinophagaceae bacterium]MBK9486819.1 hypothetical protein [Chitinophagaceae bacterium]MBL0199286.1 hypothetical protein [Chitinophagaceae bacterium]